MSRAATTVSELVIYPESDGQPVGETEIHVLLFVECLEELREFFADQNDVWVGGNIFVYYVKGDPRKVVCPDLLVVKGIPKRRPGGLRRTYQVWKERKAPNFVLELTSDETRENDMGRKFDLYGQVLKVAEYFLFDPLGDYLNPSVQGYRLRGGKYIPIRPVQGRLPSRELGLHLVVIDGMLRFYDPVAQRLLPTREEQAAARSRAEAEAQALRHELALLRQRLKHQ